MSHGNRKHTWLVVGLNDIPISLDVSAPGFHCMGNNASLSSKTVTLTSYMWRGKRLLLELVQMGRIQWFSWARMWVYVDGCGVCGPG